MEPLPSEPGLDRCFDAADEHAWAEAARRALRGVSLDALHARLPEGITLPPAVFEAAAEPSPPGSAPWTRGWRVADRRAAGWDVRAWLAGDVSLGTDAVAAGARSLWVQARGAVDLARLDRWLGGVDLEAVPVHLSVDGDARAWLDAVADRASGPLTGAVVHVGRGAGWPSEAALLRDVMTAHPWLQVGCASSLDAANAGATAVQQLGVLLAAVADRLRGMDAEGLSPSVVLPRLLLQVGVDRQVWTSVALLRAARTGWARLAAACGVSEPGFLHAVTVDLARSRRDPWTNVVRDTLSVAAAAWGGADAITCRPRDAASSGEGAASAQRLAITGQRVLCDEAHLARVADGVGGSRVVEALTTELDERGWDLFQRIEAAGGLGRSLDDGWLSAEVRAAGAERLAGARRREPLLVGSASFVAPVADAAVDEGGGEPRAAQVDFAPLRLTEPFESLQDAADRAGSRPVALLWHLGPEASHRPRAEFTRRLLEAGGVQWRDVQDLDDAPAHAAVVLVAGDDTYAARLDAALAEASRHPFVAVAGKVDPAWTAATPVALYRGGDVVAALTALHRALGVLA